MLLNNVTTKKLLFLFVSFVFFLFFFPEKKSLFSFFYGQFPHQLSYKSIFPHKYLLSTCLFIGKGMIFRWHTRYGCGGLYHFVLQSLSALSITVMAASYLVNQTAYKLKLSKPQQITYSANPSSRLMWGRFIISFNFILTFSWGGLPLGFFPKYLWTYYEEFDVNTLYVCNSRFKIQAVLLTLESVTMISLPSMQIHV